MKLVANEHSDNRFMLTSKLCPLGLSAPDLQLYTCIKYGENGIKSDFKEIYLKLAANDRSDKMFPLTLKFLHEKKKKCIKSDIKEIFFKLALFIVFCFVQTSTVTTSLQ